MHYDYRITIEVHAYNAIVFFYRILIYELISEW